MTTLLPTDPVKRGRAKLLLLAAFFALPVLGGYLAFFLDLAPRTSANYGEFLPPKPLADAALERVGDKAGDAPLRLASLRGKWVMVQFDTAACDSWCERKLYFMRQIRTAQGKDAPRIERLWLLTDDPGTSPAPMPAERLMAAIEGTHVARVGRSRIPAEFPVAGEAGRTSDHIYLVDPLGNLMMRFPRDPDPTRMIRDLQKLLKYSSAG